MKLLGPVALLVLGLIATAVAAVAIAQGRIWGVPRTGFEWQARWIRRSREGGKFWSNTIAVGAVGVGCVVGGIRAILRSG